MSLAATWSYGAHPAAGCEVGCQVHSSNELSAAAGLNDPRWGRPLPHAPNEA